MATAPGAGFTVEVDGDPYRVRVIPDPGSAFAFSPGGGMRPAAGAAVPGPGRDEPPPASAEGAVAAPMQGLLLKVRVREGDRVELGEEVAVLEAMKMQNSVTATKAGTIARIYAQEGSVVRPNQVLMTVS
jgi:biotin carboxyl carrier protein